MSIDKTEEFQKPVGNSKYLTFSIHSELLELTEAFGASGHLVGCPILHLTITKLPFYLI